jgi:hypothetical protein
MFHYQGHALKPLLLCIAGILSLSATVLHAEPLPCTDIEHCPSVRDLADELKLKPVNHVTTVSTIVHPPSLPSGPTATPAEPTRSSCSWSEKQDARNWEKLTPKVVAASAEAVKISRCEICKKENVVVVQELWGRAMARYIRWLGCSLDAAQDQSGRNVVVKELRRVLSGAVLADAGDPTALLEFMQQTELQGTTLNDVLQLYKRLQDQETRRAFLARLDDLGQSGSTLAEGVRRVHENGRADEDLLQVLLKAERVSLAMASTFLNQPDLRARRVKGLRGLQLIVEKGWQPATGESESARETAARDFVQGIKELLTMLTAEGIRQELQLYAPGTVGRAPFCDCMKDNHCRAVLLVRLEPDGTALKPSGELYFPDQVRQRCTSTSNTQQNGAAPMPERVEGKLIQVECIGGASPTECANDRVKLASQFMNQLSYRFSVFGDVAFLTVDREVDKISATFHQGVSISDLWSPPSRDIPALLNKGLRVSNSDCDADLYRSLLSRLRTSYDGQIGEPIGPDGGSTLTLSRTPNGTCALDLHDASNKKVYALTVKFETPATAADAGEDSARTVGQFYWNVQQATLIAEKQRIPLAQLPRPAAATSFLMAGAPFLFDQSPKNDAWGWGYASADTLGLLCGGVFTALNIDARNHAESGQSGAFSRAQTYLGITYGCLATSVAARIASAIHYSISK